jgi:archaemetzincin
MSLLLASCGPRVIEQIEPAPIHAPGPASETEAPASPPVEPEDEDEPDAIAEYRAKVILVPLRSFSEDLIHAVEAALRAELAVEVEVHAPVQLPESAYYAPRKRYRADELLDFLDSYAVDAGIDPAVKLLGLTEVDISTTREPHEDWGIFGLGNSPGQSAVVSSKRLTRRPKDREHVQFRVATTAVHEIGHTFGLPHCGEKQARCVMLDAEGGIENTDASTGKLGPACLRELEQLAPR